MTNSELTEEEVLEVQIKQLREAVAAMENRQTGSAGIQPEEIWTFMQQNLDENTPIHPRLHGIFNGHVELCEVERTLKRLENDLNDLKNVTESEQMYDPMEHDIDTSDPNNFEPLDKSEESDEIEEDETPSMQRDKNQRPLSAYQNSADK